ncbi:hypothetical protein F5Y01DRAFT_320024 [Xylaria sp. FL0043]|nr:hypothetical protein F5Y01DRAFT_320024 [Xylaria sp. FL0043]
MEWKMLLIGIFWAMVISLEKRRVASRFNLACLARPREPDEFQTLGVVRRTIEGWFFYCTCPRSHLYAFAFSLARYVGPEFRYAASFQLETSEVLHFLLICFHLGVLMVQSEKFGEVVWETPPIEYFS